MKAVCSLGFYRLVGNVRETTATTAGDTIAMIASDAVGNSGTGVEVNSRTLLLPKSGTHKLPEEPKPGGPSNDNPLSVVAAWLESKSCWPITNEAPMPLLNGGSNSSSRISESEPL